MRTRLNVKCIVHCLSFLFLSTKIRSLICPKCLLKKRPTKQNIKNRQRTHSTQQRRTHAALHRPTDTNNQIHNRPARPPEDTVDDAGYRQHECYYRISESARQWTRRAVCVESRFRFFGYAYSAGRFRFRLRFRESAPVGAKNVLCLTVQVPIVVAGSGGSVQTVYGNDFLICVSYSGGHRHAT
jgi:hypothetical protein